MYPTHLVTPAFSATAIAASSASVYLRFERAEEKGSFSEAVGPPEDDGGRTDGRCTDRRDQVVGAGPKHSSTRISKGSSHARKGLGTRVSQT